MAITRTGLLILLLLASSGCTRPESNTELSSADLEAIRATSEHWMSAAREGRWEDVAATYTEEAIVWFPGVKLVGRSAILDFMKGEDPMTGVDIVIEEIHGRGDMAFVSGHAVTHRPNGEDVITSTYLDVRLRQPDGTWLFHRDMVGPAPDA